VLSARAAADGAERWRVRFAGGLEARPAVAERAGAVVATWWNPDRTTVRAFDLQTGATRWERAVASAASSPVVAGDTVIVAAGDGAGHGSVHALALADGRRRWRAPVGASFEPGLVPAVDHGSGAVVVADRLGGVTAIDLATGTRRWRRATGQPSTGGAVVAAPDVVVVPDESGGLVVLDAHGRIRGRRRHPPAVPESVAGADGRVFVAWRAPGGSGVVAALEFRRRDG
jgi:outer membrane protein assembly factor BamB